MRSALSVPQFPEPDLVWTTDFRVNGKWQTPAAVGSGRAGNGSGVTSSSAVVRFLLEHHGVSQDGMMECLRLVRCKRNL